MSEDSSESLWCVYIIRCADGSLYTGISLDAQRRLDEHRSGSGRGAKYLRGRGPLEMVCSQSIGTRSAALKVEARFRKLSKDRKEEMLAGNVAADWLLSVSSDGRKLCRST